MRFLKLILGLIYSSSILAVKSDFLPPLNSFSLDVNGQYYLHKGTFVVDEVYDTSGNQLNRNTYAPTIAKNKAGFSFGLAYERRFLKTRGLFARIALGFGKLNYELGFRRELTQFWDVPALEGQVIDTIFQIEYPYIYGELRVGYKIMLGKVMEFGIWGSTQFNQTLNKYDIRLRSQLTVPHNGRIFLFDNIGSATIYQIQPFLINTNKIGVGLTTKILNQRIQFNLAYFDRALLNFTTVNEIASFRFRRITSYDENTHEFEAEITGDQKMTGRLRGLELSLSFDF